ncbi:MAG TPA: BBE domain-containing protein [Actinomycetota bacterium]|nr:BBE domain-containing protein [Actinomycetota bacterium]
MIDSPIDGHRCRVLRLTAQHRVDPAELRGHAALPAEAVYVNNLGEEGVDRVRAAFGGNYDRLAAVKAKYDPHNFFRLNQNVAPARAE